MTPTPTPSLTSEGFPASKAERTLRRMLAQRSGIPFIYFDDGEAQGVRYGISIDFMRDSPEVILSRLQAVSIKSLEAEILNKPEAASPDSPPSKLSSQSQYEILESAYWRFNARCKGYAEWKQTPQSERDAFKAEVLSVVASFTSETREQNQNGSLSREPS